VLLHRLRDLKEQGFLGDEEFERRCKDLIDQEMQSRNRLAG
jgi:hypothetical protein